MNDTNHLRGEDAHLLLNEEREDDFLLQEALLYKATDDLTYNHYAWQRGHYGIAAERLAPHYPRADKYEERYQEDVKRLQRAA